MDISKYLTNKELQLSNEDINFEKLEKDIRKGYVLSEEVEKARKETLDENTKAYSELEEKYNKLEKSYNDIEARNTELTNAEKGLKLQVEMVSQGFKKEDLDEVAKLRNSLFADEVDDTKAVNMIKEKYNATYFPKNTVDIPNETNFNKAEDKPKTIDITRNTSLKNLIIK
jgi:hypothetical protein